MPHLSWEAWRDHVHELMLSSYAHVFGEVNGEPAIKKSDIDWEQWRPWYDNGLSAREAIEKSFSAES